MTEYSASPTTRKAFDRAHEERAAAMRAAWAWLFSPKVSR